MDQEAAYFKLLADPTRLRLAILLAAAGETCVCRLSAALDEPEYKISRHLGILRHADMVQARREGTWMHYQLTPPATPLQARLRDCLRDCFANHPDAMADRQRFETAACATIPE